MHVPSLPAIHVCESLHVSCRFLGLPIGHCPVQETRKQKIDSIHSKNEQMLNEDGLQGVGE